jgi:hypothetical protein
MFIFVIGHRISIRRVREAERRRPTVASLRVAEGGPEGWVVAGGRFR